MTDALAPEDLLILTQWLSPAYPVGAFAYSHGLEQAVADGQITDCASAEAWITGVLRHGAPVMDVALMAASYQADSDDLFEIDALSRALAPSEERLLETVQQGASFANITATIWQGDLPEMTYPVAIGRAAQLQGIALLPLATMFLHGFAANLISAAIRIVPLGQTDGQAALARLSRLCPELAQTAVQTNLSEIGSSSFAADIASMRHETLYSRIFRS